MERNVVVSILKFWVFFLVESIVPFHQNAKCLVAALHSGLLCLLIGEIIITAWLTMDFCLCSQWSSFKGFRIKSFWVDMKTVTLKLVLSKKNKKSDSAEALKNKFKTHFLPEISVSWLVCDYFRPCNWYHHPSCRSLWVSINLFSLVLTVHVYAADKYTVNILKTPASL